MKKKIIGVFNFWNWIRRIDKEEEENWQRGIKGEFLKIKSNETLNKILSLVEKDKLGLALVIDKKSKKEIGIITKKDVFDALIGKIKPKEIEKLKKRES